MQYEAKYVGAEDRTDVRSWFGDGGDVDWFWSEEVELR